MAKRPAKLTRSKENKEQQVSVGCTEALSFAPVNVSFSEGVRMSPEILLKDAPLPLCPLPRAVVPAKHFHLLWLKPSNKQMKLVFVLHLLTSTSPSVTAYGQVKLTVHTDANCVTQSCCAMSLDIRIIRQPGVWKFPLRQWNWKTSARIRVEKNH